MTAHTLHETILAQLMNNPLLYRQTFGLLDPDYHDMRWEQGRPAYRLEVIAGVPVMLQDPTAFSPCTVLGAVDTESAPRLANALLGKQPEEILVFGDDAYTALRPYLRDGAWRLSHQYGVTAGAFLPRPSTCIRRLGAADREALSRRCDASEDFRSHSTWRDFEYMLRGAGACYGAFTADNLVGFCSTNPIARGNTEISWLVVDARSRRKGLASGLLTAAVQEAFTQGDSVGYYAGSAGEDLHAMLMTLGFTMLPSIYRFIPAASPGQWRTLFGRAV